MGFVRVFNDLALDSFVGQGFSDSLSGGNR